MIFGEIRKIISTVAALVVVVGGLSTAITWAIVWVEDIKASRADACIVDAKLEILNAQLRVEGFRTEYAEAKARVAIHRLDLKELRGGNDINMTKQALSAAELQLFGLMTSIEVQEAVVQSAVEALGKCE